VENSEATPELGTAAPSESEATALKPNKKFVVPEISMPVDVLEATTFFQLTDSGATN
jgi:hypothetical protein